MDTHSTFFAYDLEDRMNRVREDWKPVTGKGRSRRRFPRPRRPHGQEPTN